MIKNGQQQQLTGFIKLIFLKKELVLQKQPLSLDPVAVFMFFYSSLSAMSIFYRLSRN